MTQLRSMLKWEFTLQSRYRIIHIAIASVILYYIALEAIPFINTTFFRMTFLLFDPAMIGIMFVGVLVLFEKNENTLQALTITPMETRNYFLSKIISLTAISVVAAFLFVVLTSGFAFNYLHFFLGVIFTSVFFTLLGFIMVSRCSSINGYLLTMFFAWLVLFIPPMLHVSGLFQSPLFYICPSQASFLLFKGVFSGIALWETVYSVFYLAFWTALCYYLAKKAFYKHIVMGG